jgi:hypothetical protein
VTFVPRSLPNLQSSDPMTRPFSELTKDFDPERRERIEQRKEEIQEDFVECPECFALVYPSWLELEEDEDE